MSTLLQSDLLSKCDLPKLVPIFSYGLGSENLKNRTTATQLMADLSSKFDDDTSMGVLFGTAQHLHLLTQALTETINSSTHEELYQLTLLVLCNVMATENDDLICQLIDCDILNRLHAVVVKGKVQEAKEAMWAFSNLAMHSPEVARILASQDDIMKTIAQMINSSNISLRKEAVLTVSSLIKTVDVELLWPLLAEKLPSLLTDFFRCMQLYSHEQIVLTILDSIEYLLRLDEQLGLENYYSY